LYDPLYSKRFEIVNGITDVEGKDEPEINTTTDENKEEEKASSRVLAHCNKNQRSVFSTDRDEDALKDIKCCIINNRQGFQD
jgi:nucleosome assembly protein 1-like 1